LTYKPKAMMKIIHACNLGFVQNDGFGAIDKGSFTHFMGVTVG
jgi:hypothetical protein